MDAKLWGSANDLHMTTHFATLKDLTQAIEREKIKNKNHL